MQRAEKVTEVDQVIAQRPGKTMIHLPQRNKQLRNNGKSGETPGPGRLLSPQRTNWESDEGKVKEALQ